MSKVKVQFVGIPEVMEIYRSDGMVLHIDDEVDVSAAKALQILTEHDRWFKLTDKKIKTIEQLEETVEIEKSEVGRAGSEKGFKLLSPNGEVMVIPPGTKITIETPPEEPRKTVQQRCEVEGCNYFTKKGETRCKKHGTNHE